MRVGREDRLYTRGMPQIAVIYFSATNITARLADAACEGAGELIHVVSHRIRGQEIVDGRFRCEPALKLVDDSDAVIFGSPTFMGGPAAEFKAFADASSDRWGEARWKHKIAAGFTSGACANGDQSQTLIYFTILAAQHGMLWCNLDIPGGHDSQNRNRLGTQMGVVAQAADGALPVADILTAKHLGRQVAALALRLAAAPT